MDSMNATLKISFHQCEMIFFFFLLSIQNVFYTLYLFYITQYKNILFFTCKKYFFHINIDYSIKVLCYIYKNTSLIETLFTVTDLICNSHISYFS